MCIRDRLILIKPFGNIFDWVGGSVKCVVDTLTKARYEVIHSKVIIYLIIPKGKALSLHIVLFHTVLFMTTSHHTSQVLQLSLIHI